jgi:PAS domain S-box-containing protein
MNRGLLDPASLQQLLYQALDASDNIVLVLQQSDEASVGLVVVATNDAFCRKSGFTTPELIGRPFLSLAAPEASPAVGAAMVASARKQRSYRSELLCGHRNGAPFWLGLHLMPVPESSPPCYVLLGRDITETLRDRKQHAAIQGLLAQVFVSVHAAVAIVDDHGMIVMTNPALDSLLGYRSGGLVGRIALEVAAPATNGRAAAARARQAEDGQTYTIPVALLCADGSQIQVELTSTVVEHEDLKRFRVVTVSPAEPDSAANKLSVRVAGKIRLIGLDEVRTALGARWPAVASRVIASAEHVVRHRCGPRDSWSRTVDGGFLICFGDATEDEAAFRAATIVREIRARLIGEGETPETAYATAITGRVELPDRQDQSPDALTLAIDERLTVRLAEIEGRARKTLQSAIHSASCHLAPVRSRHTAEIVGHFATLPYALEHAVECALAALPAPDSQAFDYDRLVLGLAAEQVIGKLAAGNAQPIMVNVDFEVFLDRRRTERYVAACQKLDPRLRPQLILVLARMPYSVPKSRVLDCVMRLRPFCHAVGFQADCVELPPVEFSLLGASVVVLQEQDLNGWGAEDLAHLDKLIGVVRTHRAHTLVRQVSSRENAMRLMKLGVDLIALSEDAGRLGPG